MVPQRLRRFLVRNVRMPNAAFIQDSAARALAIIGPDARAAVPALAQALRGTDRELRWDAGIALGRIGEAAMPELINALAAKDPNVRHAAANAFYYAGPAAKPAVPALVQRLTDDSEPVRTASAQSLSQIGAAAVPALLHAIEHETGLARQAAARALIPLMPSRRVGRGAAPANASGRRSCVAAPGH